jgi:Flp pilus assembly protein TadB
MIALRLILSRNPLLRNETEGKMSAGEIINRIFSKFPFLVKVFGPADARKLIEAAGQPKGLTPEIFDTIRIAVLGIAVIAVFTFFAGYYWTPLILLAVKLPDWWLNLQIRERRRKMRRDFLMVASRLTAAQAGGLPLNKALEWAASGNEKLALRDELNICISKFGLGLTHEQIFEELAERTNLMEVRRLTTAITQAKKYGVSIVESLQQGVKDARERRKAEIIGQAKSAEQKMQIALFVMAIPSIILTLAPMVLTQMKGGMF